MKVAISASGENLEAEIDPRFGRCAYFIIAETETMDYEAVPNESMMASGGAGIQAAQFVIDKEAKAIITGNLGPNAYQTLNAGGLKLITGVSGCVKEALEKFKRGELKETDTATVGSHFGMGGGGGRRRKF